MFLYYLTGMWKQTLHTDEYALSLSRELAVCRSAIKRIRKTLELLEQKHHKTTEAFLAELQAGALAGQTENRDDFEAWQSSHASLKQWEDLEKQYQDA